MSLAAMGTLEKLYSWIPMEQDDKADLPLCHVTEAGQGQCSLTLFPICLSFSVSPSPLFPAQKPEGHLGHQEPASTAFHPGRIQVSSLQQENQAMAVGGEVYYGCVLPCGFVGSSASDSCVLFCFTTSE